MRVQKRAIKTNRRKSFKGFKNLSDVSVQSYEEIKSEIKRKVGKMPKLPKDLPEGNWTEQSLKVLKERYLSRDNGGKVVETPEEMCWRVAWEIASAETRWGKRKESVNKSARKFYLMMVRQEFLPNSPTLMNAGTNNGLQYSGCYVIPVDDSMEGIFDGIKHQAIIHKSGGGTGFSFSRLRPRGSIVGSSRGVASGPVSFMRIYDAATNEVKQGGKRRGANMGTLRIDHPDVREFINCKDGGGITNFNISLTATDKFIDAYKSKKEYDLFDPKTKKKTTKLDANEIFDEIVESAWNTGDPGFIFIDRMNRGTSNPVPALGPIESTNPCGEQPLYPYDACNLGSIFLEKFIKTSEKGKTVDWDRLKETTRDAVRFLDNVIEVNPYPLDEIRRTVFAIRRIGLGIGGWADMLVELGIPYDSQKALKLASKVMRTIQNEAVLETQRLAEKRGPFPLFPISIYKNKKPRRNSTVTTIAPTGTISIIAGSSSGIEPYFAIAFQHIVKDKHLERELNFTNPKFEEIAKKRGFWSEEIKKRVAENGVVRDIEEIPEDVKKIFGTAQEIGYEWHIKMQSAFQKYTENAVSKTINLPNNATREDIKRAYLMALDEGCKGITVFRDGSKDVQVLNLGVKKDKQLNTNSKAWTRPMKIGGATYKILTPVGTAYITVNDDGQKNPIEVFINIGRAGSDVQAMAEALGRLISKTLKFESELTIKERAQIVIEQLKGIGGRRSVGFGPNKILSLPDAVSYALAMHLGINGGSYQEKTETAELPNGEVKPSINLEAPQGLGVSDVPEPQISATVSAIPSSEEHTVKKVGDICPSCGASTFVYQEGCSKCYACGHSEC